MNEHFQTPEEAVNWITGLVSFGIRPGLQRIEKLMEHFGHPQRRLKFIHVAGTNGKGSVCAYISHVLRKCGYDVGTFNSPYIERFTDRIQVNGQDIDGESLLAIANRIKSAADEIARTELGPLTMFEAATALALVYFAERAYPDFVVWETGLGGRLDCTNIVYPVISVITNIGHDHMEVLGDTLEKVAAEKAGIIKSGVPVVSAASQPGAVEVLREHARAKKSTLYLLGTEYRFEPVLSRENEQEFHFAGPFRRLDRLRISMSGGHQLENAAVAVMALEALRQYMAVVIDDDQLREGLWETHWPGRLEMVGGEPPILLDGAHNPEGAEALAAALANVYRYRKLRVMFGMIATKNHPGFLRHILPLVDTLIITEPDWRKKMPAADLRRVADELLQADNPRKTEIFLEPEWKKALALLKERTEAGDLAVVTGTLYLIADVRAWIVKQSDCEKGW